MLFTNFGIVVFIIVTLCNGYSEAAKISSWENVFRDFRSTVIPLRHWGNKSYFLAIGHQATWFNAIDFCRNIKMKLLSIRSKDENDQIYKYIREASKGFEYWMGGTRLIDGQKWVWLPYGEEIDYTNWGNSQPSDPNGEKCLQLWKQGEQLVWNDRPCNTQFHFICERYDSENDQSTGVGNL